VPAIVMIALATTAIPAYATTDRADYAAQVNSICVGASAKVEPLVDTQHRRAKTRALAILGRELRSLRRVGPAPGDEALVASWLADRTSIQRLAKRDLAIAARLQRLEDKYFNGRQQSTRRLKPLVRRVALLGRTINRIQGRVGRAADAENSIFYTLDAIDCIGSIGPEDLLQG
jgi:hypothetical protein